MAQHAAASRVHLVFRGQLPARIRDIANRGPRPAHRRRRRRPHRRRAARPRVAARHRRTGPGTPPSRWGSPTFLAADATGGTLLSSISPLKMGSGWPETCAIAARSISSARPCAVVDEGEHRSLGLVGHVRPRSLPGRDVQARGPPGDAASGRRRSACPHGRPRREHPAEPLRERTTAAERGRRS